MLCKGLCVSVADLCVNLFVKKRKIALKLYVNYVLSNRCKNTVRETLKKFGYHFIFVDTGEVELMEHISPEEREALKISLRESGLELMDDKSAFLFQKMKSMIIETVYQSEESIKMSLPAFVSERLTYDYSYLSTLFSEVSGTSIGEFINFHKIERIKELIIYEEFNLTDISAKFHYNNLAQLKQQFKKITGLSPSHFRKVNEKRRNATDDCKYQAVP